MKALFIYSTHDGQTKKITTKLIETLSQEMSTDVVNIESAEKIDLTGYDVICVGAAIRYGYFNKKIKAFINDNAEILNRNKTAFFSVTLIARKLEKRTPETNSYTRKLLQSIAWKPSIAETFAGALHYPRYNWLDKMMIKLIMKMTGGETDTTQDIEYTDWQQVDAFADKLITLAKTEQN